MKAFISEVVDSWQPSSTARITAVVFKIQLTVKWIREDITILFSTFTPFYLVPLLLRYPGNIYYEKSRVRLTVCPSHSSVIW